MTVQVSGYQFWNFAEIHKNLAQAHNCASTTFRNSDWKIVTESWPPLGSCQFSREAQMYSWGKRDQQKIQEVCRNSCRILLLFFFLSQFNSYSNIRRNLGKPQGIKSRLTLDFCWTALTPSLPLYLWTGSRNFFFQPHIKQAKVPQQVWNLVGHPPFLGKCPNFSCKSSS